MVCTEPLMREARQLLNYSLGQPTKARDLLKIETRGGIRPNYVTWRVPILLPVPKQGLCLIVSREGLCRGMNHAPCWRHHVLTGNWPLMFGWRRQRRWLASDPRNRIIPSRDACFRWSWNRRKGRKVGEGWEKNVRDPSFTIYLFKEIKIVKESSCRS